MSNERGGKEGFHRNTIVKALKKVRGGEKGGKERKSVITDKQVYYRNGGFFAENIKALSAKKTRGGGKSVSKKGGCQNLGGEETKGGYCLGIWKKTTNYY